jgi:hypothetical protein
MFCPIVPHTSGSLPYSYYYIYSYCEIMKMISSTFNKLMSTRSIGSAVSAFASNSFAPIAEIDTQKTKMDEFYNWDELDYRTGTEDCWRHLQIPKGLIDCVIFRREVWKATGLPLSLELETFFME